MKPLPIDERRVGRLADICDAIEAETPRNTTWKVRRQIAYRELADACNIAARNATP